MSLLRVRPPLRTLQPRSADDVFPGLAALAARNHVVQAQLRGRELAAAEWHWLLSRKMLRRLNFTVCFGSFS